MPSGVPTYIPEEKLGRAPIPGIALAFGVRA